MYRRRIAGASVFLGVDGVRTDSDNVRTSSVATPTCP